MKAKLCTLLALLLWALSGCALKAPRANKASIITFLDVGEGAATLIDSPDLGRILIDTGNPSSRLISKLNNIGVKSIDKLILTHPHPDHIGGAFAAIEFLNPKMVYDNGEMLDTAKPEERWYLETVRERHNYAILKEGDSFDSGSATLKILSSKRMARDWNTNSLVILFNTQGISVLLMADGNFATEESILSTNNDLKSHILQVGHHGAKDASLIDFLNAVSPQYSVISSNKDNINGYPAKKTLNKLAAVGSKILLTSEQGTITFEISSEGKLHLRHGS